MVGCIAAKLQPGFYTGRNIHNFPAAANRRLRATLHSGITVVMELLTDSLQALPHHPLFYF